MKTSILASTGILLSCMLAAGIAQADASMASLVSVSGKVLVDQGKGFVTAKPGMVLGEQDRIITLKDSAASVAFADGCVSKLKSNNLLTVDKEAGCSKQAVSTQEQPLRYAAAIGDTRTDVPATAGVAANNPGPAVPAYRGAMLIFTGAGIAGIAADGNNHKGDSTPISLF